MKHLIKTSLLLIALLAASSVYVSCVEDEKEPSFTDGGGTGNIDVKMPAPYTVSLNLGSEVILKGSGFSQRDEVYVQQRVHNDSYDEGYGDYGTTGAKVKAKITKYTSTELTFIIPDDALGGENSGEAYVFFRRNGKEYKLGYMSIEPLNVYVMNGDATIGGWVTLRSEIESLIFTKSDKVFLQKVEFDYNGKPVAVSDKVQAEVIEAISDQLTFTVPITLTEGQYSIFVEQSNFKFRVNDFLFLSPFVVGIDGYNGYSYYSGEIVHLFMQSNSSFLESDKVFLQRYGGQDADGNLIGTGEKVLAQVVNFSLSDLFFELPMGIWGEYIICLKRGDAEFVLRQPINIQSPVQMYTSFLYNDEELGLYSVNSNNFYFVSTDKVYLQPVRKNEQGEYEDVGNKVEIQVRRTTYDELYCTLSAGLSGTYAVILIHEGIEYRLEKHLNIYAR